VKVGLADDDRAGCRQPLRDRGILRRHAIVEHRAGGGGPHTGGVDVVLERDRYSVQRAAQLALALLGVERSRLCEGGLTHHGDERVDLRVVDLDASEAGVDELDGGDRACLDAGGGVGEADGRERIRGGGTGCRGGCAGGLLQARRCLTARGATRRRSATNQGHRELATGNRGHRRQRYTLRARLDPSIRNW
jgi:hypothetical protein